MISKGLHKINFLVKTAKKFNELEIPIFYFLIIKLLKRLTIIYQNFQAFCQLAKLNSKSLNFTKYIIFQVKLSIFECDRRDVAGKLMASAQDFINKG